MFGAIVTPIFMDWKGVAELVDDGQECKIDRERGSGSRRWGRWKVSGMAAGWAAERETQRPPEWKFCQGGLYTVNMFGSVCCININTDLVVISTLFLSVLTYFTLGTPRR